MGKLEKEFFIEDEPELVEKLTLIGAGVEETGVVKLPLIEAAYFEEKKVISTGKSSGELVELALENDSLAKERFSVLKHLRDKGYIVRWGVGDSEFMRIYRKGIRIGQDRTESVLKVLREGEKPEIETDLVGAGRMRKELVYAFVGEQVTFVKAYRVNFE